MTHTLFTTGCDYCDPDHHHIVTFLNIYYQNIMVCNCTFVIINITYISEGTFHNYTENIN